MARSRRQTFRLGGPRIVPPGGDGLAAVGVGPQAAGAARLRDLLTLSVPLALTATGLVLWMLALPEVDLRGMTDIGLVSVLPAQVFVALGLVTAGFVASLHFRPVAPLLLVHVLAIVLILFGTTSIVEPTPHMSATWRHAGIVDYFGRVHHVNARIDAYFNWPGFFIFSAFVANVAGATSTIEFARWAPLLYDIAFLLPVFLIVRAVVADRRLVWATAWLFSIANWVAQDYFSPQATTYLLYLVALAVLLSCFATRASTPVAVTGGTGAENVSARLRVALRLPPAIAPRGTPAQRIFLVLALIVVIGATVPTHQLTPFALLAAVTGLVAVRACRARGLPLVVLVMIAAWVVFMAVAFLSGHFGSVAGSVGKVDQNVSSSLGGRLHGSYDHLIVAVTRVAVTGGLWLLAIAGLARRLRRGYRDLSFFLLAFAPFLLIGLQSYGGEILLRIYLFALPFIAFFVAALFFATPRATVSWRASLGLALVSTLLVLGFLVSRYGNERTDYFTKGEVGAVAYVNRVAPDGALMVSLSRDYPRKFERYEQFRSVFVSELPSWSRLDGSGARLRAAVGNVRRAMLQNRDGRGSYLVVTRSQIAYLETFSDVQPRALELLIRRLQRSPQFRTVYENRDAFVMRLRTARPA
jgi:hypothetical protein